MSWPPYNDKIPEGATQPGGKFGFSPLVRLGMRMGWFGGSAIMNNNGSGSFPDAIRPFEFLSAYECTANNKVYLFVVLRGQTMTFEDDIYMFPSDSLIGRLKLLT